jgi:hypothetical protein
MYFYPSFSTFPSFHKLDLLSAASTPWFLPIFHLDVTWLEEKLPRRVPAARLTVVGINKTGQSGLPN